MLTHSTASYLLVCIGLDNRGCGGVGTSVQGTTQLSYSYLLVFRVQLSYSYLLVCIGLDNRSCGGVGTGVNCTAAVASGIYSYILNKKISIY